MRHHIPPASYAQRSLEAMQTIFTTGDFYRVSYGKNQKVRCPAGLRMVSSHEDFNTGTNSVTFEALCDVVVPQEAFYGPWTKCLCVQDESQDWWKCPEHGPEIKQQRRYIEDLQAYLEYRNDLISEGHRDLRKPQVTTPKDGC